uniref:DUF2358 domain-containing protein n=1 Tax=Desertifilum tharense IPPAS B-1220 TaxID=1781255 RepID=A0ACD5GR71_9CYAN
MDILDILKQDYQRFPKDQTYSVYAKDVYFKDPLNEFRGVERFKKMIQFIDTFFINPQMDLHDIQRQEDTIHYTWTLSWNTPFPGNPASPFPYRTELKLSDSDTITSHVDYWNCSRLDVVKQHFVKKTR